MIQSAFTKQLLFDLEACEDQLIEAFVSVYGKKHKERITKAIKDVTLIIRGTNESMLSHLHQLYIFKMAESWDNDEARKYYIAKDQSVRAQVERLTEQERDFYTNNPYSQEVIEKHKARANRWALDTLQKVLKNQHNIVLSEQNQADIATILKSEQPDFDKLFTYIDSLKPGLVKEINFEKDNLAARLAECDPLYSQFYSYVQEIDGSLLTTDAKEMFNKSKSAFFAGEKLKLASELSDSFYDFCGGQVVVCEKPEGGVGSYLFLNDTVNLIYDHLIVHELVHVVNTNRIELDNGDYLLGTGFHMDKMRKGEPVDQSRGLTNEAIQMVDFNETVTEYLASEISNELGKQGTVFVVNQKDRIKTNNYRKGFFVLELIYDVIKEQLIEYSASSDFAGLAKAIGQENLEEIIDLVHGYSLGYGQDGYKHGLEVIEESIGQELSSEWLKNNFAELEKYKELPSVQKIYQAMELKERLEERLLNQRNKG